MRDIKFRAKNKDDNEWIEGYLFETDDHTYIGYARQTDDDLFYGPANIFIEVDKDTVCQYVGFKDKNGKYIYEGDIVKVPDEEEYFILKWDEDTARFIMEADTFVVDFDNYWNYEIEVVGNIFDNPELI